MKYDWIFYENNIETRGIVGSYCADGDGIFSIEQRKSGGFSLKHQGDFVKRLSSNFNKAIIQAEAYMKETSEGFYLGCITQSLQAVLTIEGKTQAFEMDVNGYGIPYFEDHVDSEMCEFIGEGMSLLPEMLEQKIAKGSVKGSIKGKDSEDYLLKKSVSYIVLVNGDKCTVDQMQAFCQMNAY